LDEDMKQALQKLASHAVSVWEAVQSFNVLKIHFVTCWQE